MSAPPERALAGVFQVLEQDLVTVEVVAALEAASVPVLVLKGPTTASWLYGPGELRPYADTDLLVPRPALRAAARVLRGQGFRPEHPGTPWRHRHARRWDRGDRQVDLHHTLGLVDRRVDPWPLLGPTAEEVVVAGRPVRGLGAPGRCLHVALHASQSVGMASEAKAIEDLRRALTVAGEPTWREAHGLARALGCEPELGASLRLLPDGAVLAERLGLGDEASAVLRARRSDRWRRPARLVAAQRTWRGRAGQVGYHLTAPLRRLQDRRPG